MSSRVSPLTLGQRGQIISLWLPYDHMVCICYIVKGKGKHCGYAPLKCDWTEPWVQSKVWIWGWLSSGLSGGSGLVPRHLGRAAWLAGAPAHCGGAPLLLRLPNQHRKHATWSHKSHITFCLNATMVLVFERRHATGLYHCIHFDLSS